MYGIASQEVDFARNRIQQSRPRTPGWLERLVEFLFCRVDCIVRICGRFLAVRPLYARKSQLSCLPFIATYIGKREACHSQTTSQSHSGIRESAQKNKHSGKKGGVQTLRPLPFVACLAFRPLLLACSFPNKEFIKSMLVAIFGVPFSFDAVGVSSVIASRSSNTWA